MDIDARGTVPKQISLRPDAAPARTRMQRNRGGGTAFPQAGCRAGSGTDAKKQGHGCVSVPYILIYIPHEGSCAEHPA